MKIKKKNVLISFVGTNDAGKTIGKGDGAILTLLKARKFNEVNLIWTKSENEKTDIYKIAIYLEKEIQERKHCKNINLHPMTLINVTDHNEIYPKLLNLCNEIFKGRRTGTKITASISSGTPSMQVCWILMAESGDFPFELLRVNPPEFNKTAYTEVKLDTALPKITRLEKEIKKVKKTNESLLPEIKLHIKTCELFIGDETIILGPIEFCYYRYFLERAKDGKNFLNVSSYELSEEFTEKIVKYYYESFPEFKSKIKYYKEKLLSKKKVSIYTFHPNIVKINKKITDTIKDENIYKYYQIINIGMKQSPKFGINLKKEKIKILD